MTPVLGTVDRRLTDVARGEAAVQRPEERVGQIEVERRCHLLAVVGCGHLRHLDELCAVAARPHGVRTQRGEHRARRRPWRSTCDWVVARPSATTDHLQVDDGTGRRRPDELCRDPLQRTVGRLLRCFGRRGDAAAAVQEAERRRQVGTHLQAVAVRARGLEVEEVECGQHRSRRSQTTRSVSGNRG